MSTPPIQRDIWKCDSNDVFLNVIFKHDLLCKYFLQALLEIQDFHRNFMIALHCVQKKWLIKQNSSKEAIIK